MIEIGRRFSLGTEPLHVCGAGQLAGQNHLHGDGAIQTDLAGAIDYAHSAAGDFLQQFVVAKVTNACSGGRLACRRGRHLAARIGARSVL